MRLDEATKAIITEYWNVKENRQRLSSRVEGYGYLFISMTNLLEGFRLNDVNRELQKKLVNLAANIICFLTEGLNE